MMMGAIMLLRMLKKKSPKPAAPMADSTHVSWACKKKIGPNEL